MYMQLDLVGLQTMAMHVVESKMVQWLQVQTNDKDKSERRPPMMHVSLHGVEQLQPLYKHSNVNTMFCLHRYIPYSMVSAPLIGSSGLQLLS